ncbi:hypothetical protein PGT21_000537 [Puccinia graminis f. sp. tritici]|uniref:Uncharacterized protein n=1 Tax=Puccinia graminis f. sp. tritici TaxID=56615 RepID=A0A5B0MTA6_PUCGR|nr:hypothetical protein PGT21_000537 [Puccinia graminis f. sp. tritici]
MYPFPAYLEKKNKARLKLQHQPESNTPNTPANLPSSTQIEPNLMLWMKHESPQHTHPLASNKFSFRSDGDRKLYDQEDPEKKQRPVEVETIRSAESLTDEGRTIFNELDPNAPFHESSNSALSHPSTLISDSHKSNSYLKLNQHGNLSAAADSLLSATQDLHHSPELVDYDALTLDRELSLKIKQTQEHLEASLKALKDLLIKTGSIGSGGNERSLSVNSSFTRPELNDRNHTQPQTQPTHQNRPIGSSQSSVITNASQMKSKPRVKLTQPATTISYLSSSTAAICHQRSPSRPNSNPK